MPDPKRLLVLVSLCLAACVAPRTLTEPLQDDDGMIVLSFEYESYNLFGNTRNASLRGVEVCLWRQDEDGRLSALRQSHRSGNYFFFTGLRPGVYRMLGVSTRGALVFRFSDEVLAQTAVRVGAGEAVFMGDFSGAGWLDFREALETAGRRTQAGQRAAMEYLTRNFPASVWQRRWRALEAPAALPGLTFISAASGHTYQQQRREAPAALPGLAFISGPAGFAGACRQ